MIAVIRRLSTDYVYPEDRLRLSAELASAPPVTMWLTQRLALRLLPKLLRWLDLQIGATAAPGDEAPRSTTPELQTQVVHAFAQEVALAELKQESPVQAAASDGWLIQSVELALAEGRIGLAFRAADGRAAGVGVTVQELRQWLAILRGLWLLAEWPPALWPAWMQGEAAPSGRQLVLH